MSTPYVTAFERGQAVPDFTLQDMAGETVSSRSYYMRRNLIVALLPSEPDQTWLNWVSGLHSAVQSIPEADGEVVCLLIAQPGSEAVLREHNNEDRFRILLDEKSLVEERFHHNVSVGLLLVADRYGEIFHSASGEPSSPGMSPEDVPSWVELIACRCS